MLRSKQQEYAYIIRSYVYVFKLNLKFYFLQGSEFRKKMFQKKFVSFKSNLLYEIEYLVKKRLLKVKRSLF